MYLYALSVFILGVVERSFLFLVFARQVVSYISPESMNGAQSINDVPIITRLKTYDADELAEFVRGWDQEHIRLSKGTFEWETCIIQIDGFQFSEEFYGAPLLCRGSTPVGTYTIGIPKLYAGEALYGGNIVSEHCCLTGNSAGYLDFRTGHKTGIFLITAPIEQLLASAERMQWLLTPEQMLSPGLMTPKPMALKQLSNFMEELLALVKTYPERLTDQSTGASMAHLILEDLLPLLLDVLTSGPNFLPENDSSRGKMVRQAEAFMRDRIAAPITLSELCQEVHTSQRSLYYAFEECVGLPPMDYLKLLRLHGVRRALQSVNPLIYKVYEIAGRWGFWHMGQFSRDYKMMFGEPPSTTLRCNRDK